LPEPITIIDIEGFPGLISPYGLSRRRDRTDGRKTNGRMDEGMGLGRKKFITVRKIYYIKFEDDCY
jgi:hypothetical protein